ncbi:MAG: class I SAM-dependent methyltransferase [Planctomycetota bacterium]|jgi:SAM-dependent methyltransferase
MKTLGIFAVTVLAVPTALAQDPATAEPQPTAVEMLRAEAWALAPLVRSDLARRFLEATADLPEIAGERVVWWNRAKRRALRPQQAAAMDEAELEGFRELTLGGGFYYYTAYGTPLAYARALDLAAAHGFESADDRRILDFGFGGIGHLRLLASLGGHATGIEILELLREFYREPGDTGEIPRSAAAASGSPGSLTLVYGSFPGDAQVRRAVGDGFDLVVSKNVLKLGYVHPEREADPRRLVHLGVDDETFVRAVHDVLNPGGLFVIYNLYPQQNPPDEPYIPHATGGCPFDRDLVESVGFEVVAFDRDDTEDARRMGKTLGWDDSMDLETDLFGMYTILRKPGA